MNENEPAMANCITTKMGEIKEITRAARERIDTAELLAGRLHELRLRLIGDDDGGVDKIRVGDAAPEPVRPEIHELGHSMDVLREVLERATNDLANLERL